MKLSAADTEILMHTKLFHGTAESVLSKMALGHDCEMAKYEKGDIIFTKQNFRRSLGIILEGSARVLKENADGHKIVMNILTMGDMFGAAALFNEEEEYVSELCASEPCRIIFFSQRLIERGIERDYRLAENYIRYLSERILFLNRKIFFLTAGTAEQRLANFIINNLSENASDVLTLTMVQLASELNISRASLYRALDSLSDAGAISKTGKNVRIADIEKLKCIVG